MARDPLEGVRPADMASRPTLVSGGSGRGSGVVLVFVILGAVLAGAVAYFVSKPSAPSPVLQPVTATPTPSASATPAGTPTASSHG